MWDTREIKPVIKLCLLMGGPSVPVQVPSVCRYWDHCCTRRGLMAGSSETISAQGGWFFTVHMPSASTARGSLPALGLAEWAAPLEPRSHPSVALWWGGVRQRGHCPSPLLGPQGLQEEAEAVLQTETWVGTSQSRARGGALLSSHTKDEFSDRNRVLGKHACR